MTAPDLLKLIAELPTKGKFSYIDNPEKTVSVAAVHLDKERLEIRRFDQSKFESISSNMLWRVADAIRENTPLNFDRLLGSSYNTRSALEALLAHTPPFFYCYPGRIERMGKTETIKTGHKHLLWCPGEPHENGVICEKKIDTVISEVPARDIFYDMITLTQPNGKRLSDVSPGVRRHTQIQISLYIIGRQLGYRTWIAQNDRRIEYQNKRLSEHDAVVKHLQDETLLDDYNEAQKAALLIDCIWFKNSHLLPAVMEIEHSTGVTSGLDRMLTLYEYIKPFQTRWVIVAPDDDRNLVFKHCQKPQFRKMKPRFFAYSAVEELNSLCSNRKLRGISEDFLDCFMEQTVPEN